MGSWAEKGSLSSSGQLGDETNDDLDQEDGMTTVNSRRRHGGGWKRGVGRGTGRVCTVMMPVMAIRSVSAYRCCTTCALVSRYVFRNYCIRKEAFKGQESSRIDSAVEGGS